MVDYLKMAYRAIEAIGDDSPFDSDGREALAAREPTIARAAADVDNLGWDWFAYITDEDRRYLLGPRRYADRCLWCYRRGRHTAACEELHEEWAIRLPMGKYVGKKVSEVPGGYLQWLLRSGARLSPDLRDEIHRVLR